MIHTCHAALMPFSDSAVSFVKVRVVAGNIRTANSYSLTDWYASDNNLRGTPRGGRKKPNAGRSSTWRLWTANVNSHMPCPCRAVSWPWSVAFRTAWSWHGTGAAWELHGMCELAFRGKQMRWYCTHTHTHIYICIYIYIYLYPVLMYNINCLL
jgi:hypothetical protein